MVRWKRTTSSEHRQHRCLYSHSTRWEHAQYDSKFYHELVCLFVIYYKDIWRHLPVLFSCWNQACAQLPPEVVKTHRLQYSFTTSNALFNVQGCFFTRGYGKTIILTDFVIFCYYYRFMFLTVLGDFYEIVTLRTEWVVPTNLDLYVWCFWHRSICHT